MSEISRRAFRRVVAAAGTMGDSKASIKRVAKAREFAALVRYAAHTKRLLASASSRLFDEAELIRRECSVDSDLQPTGKSEPNIGGTLNL